MNESLKEEVGLYNCVFAGLLVLTGLTVFLSRSHPVRSMAVAGAAAVAAIKAGLIGWHFMHLKRAPAVVWWIVAVGLTAAGILAIGVLPDMAWKF